MDISQVKKNLNKIVLYDTGQINFSGESKKEFILTGCILRKKKNGPFYYQAELTDSDCRNSVIIDSLEQVIAK